MMRRVDTASTPPVVFYGLIIPWGLLDKDLSLRILDWRAQVTQVSHKVTGNLLTLHRLKNFLPPKTKTILYKHSIHHAIKCAPT